MVAVPLKPEYGPTLGRLLAPRWHAARAGVRAAVMALVIALVAGAVGVALTLENAHYRHGGSMPFSFAYRDLYRAPSDAYVRLVGHGAEGVLNYSYTVEPLALPPYRGTLSGELPVFATGYERTLAAGFTDFAPAGEGKTRVNGVPGYQLLFTARVEGREMYGRDVLLLPHDGARRGVSIVMLTAAGITKEVQSPMEVASEGVLLRPLKTFSFG